MNDGERNTQRLLVAFGTAATFCENGDEHAVIAAFDLAESLGWKWAEDEGFMDFCLKATPLECLAFGLSIALERQGYGT